ncbi:MAG: ABC transporter ATP-binding protein [Clostridia bacterium]|nr:ABC transporter ATP-binding protein [Clostridia bacterium]
MNVLELKGISKSFDGKVVVDDVSFCVGEGKIVGLLGKNGSGKSTIIKMVNDLLTIDSGEIAICGEKISEKTKAMVSYLPERTYLSKDLTIMQTIQLFSDFYTDFDAEKAKALLKDLDLDQNASLSKMSKGMKEKVQLVLVMSRAARLYVLDEPLSGVDPSTRDHIMRTILTNLNQDCGLLITTHLVSDVEKILDEVVFIDKGRIVLSGNADELRQKENDSIDGIFRSKIK